MNRSFIAGFILGGVASAAYVVSSYASNDEFQRKVDATRCQVSDCVASVKSLYNHLHKSEDCTPSDSENASWVKTQWESIGY